MFKNLSLPCFDSTDHELAGTGESQVARVVVVPQQPAYPALVLSCCEGSTIALGVHGRSEAHSFSLRFSFGFPKIAAGRSRLPLGYTETASWFFGADVAIDVMLVKPRIVELRIHG